MGKINSSNYILYADLCGQHGVHGYSHVTNYMLIYVGNMVYMIQPCDDMCSVQQEETGSLRSSELDFVELNLV